MNFVKPASVGRRRKPIIIAPPAGAVPVTWNNTLNLIVSGSNVRHSKATYFCRGNSDQILSSANSAGYFQFQGSASENWANAGIYLMPVPTPQTTNGARHDVSSFLQSARSYSASGLNFYRADASYATGIDPIAPTDVVKFKFSANREPLIVYNDIVIFTGAAVAIGDYTLFVVLDNNDAGTPGLDNILFQS